MKMEYRGLNWVPFFSSSLIYIYIYMLTGTLKVMVNTTFKKVLILFLWEMEKSIKTFFFFPHKNFLKLSMTKIGFPS